MLLSLSFVVLVVLVLLSVLSLSSLLLLSLSLVVVVVVVAVVVAVVVVVVAPAQDVRVRGVFQPRVQRVRERPARPRRAEGASHEDLLRGLQKCRSNDI